ncbi:hypothetical protein MKW92_028960 [Papaver armeniacum]|nr:hypothetical protein MKW92_028960 [Papaver armeniacum]
MERSNPSIASVGGKGESRSEVHPADIFEVIGLKHLPGIIEKYSKSEYPVKCLLFDSICPWVLDISKRFGLIAAAFYTQSCSVNAIYYNIQKGSISIPVEGPTLSAPCLPLLATHEIPSHVYDIDSRPTSLSLCLKQFSNVDEIQWHFFNTFDKLESEVQNIFNIFFVEMSHSYSTNQLYLIFCMQVMNWMALQSTTKVMAIGPTIPSMYLDNRMERDQDYDLHLYSPDTNACNHWLATKEASSVVYVSFGSMASLGKDQMEEIAWGLRNSNYHFLWVVRSSEEDKLPSKFMEETTGKGLVVSWCQQMVVLAHGAVGCFVTHCGWNSTLEGMSDQMTNAKFIEDVWKVGKRVKVDGKGLAKRDKLEECIKEVMEGDRREEMKRNAVMWKKLAKEAVDIGGSSDKNIEEFMDAKASSKSHVLVLPFPVQSHINPMIQFSKCLASKGLKVTLATTFLLTTNFSPTGAYLSVDRSWSHFGTNFILVIVLEKPLITTLLCKFPKQSGLGYPVKCLLYDSVIPWASNVAKELGLIGAAFYTQSCSVNAIYYTIYKGLVPTPIEDPVTAVPGLPVIEAEDLPSFVYKIDSYPHILNLVLNQFANMDDADWHFLNTFDKLEDEVVNWLAKQSPTRVLAIGPTIPSMYLDNSMEGNNSYGLDLFPLDSDDYMKWLDTKEVASVVYISFGSLASLSEDQMEEICWALKSCNYNFLWVVRELEEDKLHTKFVEETLGMGLVVKWCRQLQVLAHKSIGCFVTHAGWNSTLEGLSSGVPMVAVPQSADQPTNAKFIEDVWMVGVRATGNENGIVVRQILENCIREVMEGDRKEEMKRNAVKWKELAKEAVDENGSSNKNIQEFVTSMLCISEK